MSNVNQNRLNTVLAEPDLTAISTAITTILAKIPANAALSEDERAIYNAIDVANKVFCDNVLTEAQQTGSGIISPFVNLPWLKNDLDLYSQMNTIESQLLLVQRVQDVKRVTGHEAFKISGIIYGDYSRAAAAGVDNAKSAFENLKSRYSTPGGGRPVDTIEE